MNKFLTKKDSLRYGSWIFLLHTLIIIPISFLYYRNIELNAGVFTYFYLTILTISHFAFLQYLIFGILYIPFTFFFTQKKILQTIAILIFSTSIFILLIDTEVYKLYRFHINSFTLNLLFGGNGLEIFEFSSSLYLFAVLIFFAIILFEFFVLKLFNYLFKKEIL